MEKKYNAILSVFVMLFIGIVILFGCAKAEESGGKNQGENSSTVAKSQPNKDSNSDNVLLGKKMSQSIKDIEGIDKATVFIKETTALVGVTLKDGSQEVSDELRKKIDENVKTISPDIRKVAISANKEIFEKLEAMADDFMNGKTIEELKKDLSEILERIKS